MVQSVPGDNPCGARHPKQFPATCRRIEKSRRKVLMPPPVSPPPTIEPRTSSASESRYFDGLITGRGEFNPFTDRGWRTLARRFTRMIAPDRPLRLLDVGCGTGQSRRLYAQYVKLYAGIDLSYEALRFARQQAPDSHWARADACVLPFADGAFDVVAFSSVLHHIPDYASALREALRVLRPGGQVFAFDPNLLHPAMALFRHPASPLYLSAGVSPNERPLTSGALRHAFTSAGFLDVRQRCQSNIPFRSVAPRLIDACIGLYNVADWLMEYTGLARCFGTFVVTAGKKRGPR
jgi:ubiquinone/menaquinone biosynthesis C-methylase UbiE